MTSARQLFPLVFECDGDRLLGVVHRPDRPCTLGVVVVVGGPQYRIGSHRQFVEMAQDLAARDIAVFRFDYRGMGDSEGENPGFEHIAPDIRAAVDAFTDAVPEVERVALFGLCDGASGICSYAPSDPRVTAVALANPWVREAASHQEALLRHYYRRRLFQKSFWQKLLGGRVQWMDFPRLLGRVVYRQVTWLAKPKPSGIQQNQTPLAGRLVDALNSYHGQILLALSGQDIVASEFEQEANKYPEWRALLHQGRVERLVFPDADHTFSSDRSARELTDAILNWLEAKDSA